MTTKPKAKKFRIKRAGGLPSGASAPEAAEPAAQPEVVRRPVPLKLAETQRQSAQATQPAPQQPQQPQQPRPSAPAAQTPTPRPAAAAPRRPAPADVASPAQVSAETNIDAIRREGLTGRQLRMARRVAQKNGIATTSDFEAVKLLRERGIDPFQRANSLELVVPNETAPAEQKGRVQLPQTVKDKPENLPSTDRVTAADRRATEIQKIQQDIAKRRKRKMALLFTRLAVFVGIPTFLMGFYFSQIATPMYATHSAFLIQQNEASGASAGGLGSMFGTSQLATVQDSIAVQGYLTSREAMLRLNDDLGFKQHFQDSEIDAITRLPADASNEQAYKLYKKHVKIGYDPTEGIINMEVIAASPEASEAFSESLISYAEEQISDLSQRLRTDQMQGARDSYAEAESNRAEAAQRLVELQTELQTVDAASVIAASQTRIAQFETMLEEKKLELQAQLGNRRPNQARVEGLQRDIQGLEASIADQRSKLTQASGGQQSLASVQAQINIATIDFQTRDAMLQQALQALETARIAADRQVRYIAMSENPVAPDSASYPRVFENTVLAFLIFAGIYLMISLTASILREQVSS